MTAMTEQLTLGEMIAKLIALGEDRDELGYWQSIHEDLSPEQQVQLYQDLQEELMRLTKVTKP